MRSMDADHSKYVCVYVYYADHEQKQLDHSVNINFAGNGGLDNAPVELFVLFAVFTCFEVMFGYLRKNLCK